ncbi:MAG: DNA helicase PcrA [Bacillota bacterium]
MNLLSTLNERQAEAVGCTEGPLLVLAGAGSGKTRVLTTRIAYLIQQVGIEPGQILAITFTNKSAREMRERVAAMLPDAARDLWISTFHAACLRILRRQAGLSGYGPGFVIYDDADQITLVKQCLKELNLDDKKFAPRAILSSISSAKNQLVDEKAFAAQADDYYSRTVSGVYTLYQGMLKKNNALDFDDLLMQTVLLLQGNPGVLNYYQHRFRYILVDEYQDTNHAQYVLVNLLAREHRNLCVVGDDDQSIYSWRGADLKNILDFERDYPEARVIKLEQNYRSTGNILSGANAIIKHNKLRKQKRLWTSAGEGRPIVVFTGENEYTEAAYVCDRIQRLKSSGNLDYSNFAILYRTHAQSRVLEETLAKSRIPYVIFGGQRFYDRKEIKDLIAYLRVIVNPGDRLALARIVNVPKRGIGPASLQKIMIHGDITNVSPVEALVQAAEVSGLSSKVRAGAVALGLMLQGMAKNVDTVPVTKIVEDVLQRSGYWAELQGDPGTESKTRQENLKEFLSVTGEYDREVVGGSLAEFMADLALLTDADQQQNTGEQVVLMTLHGAKGLEFPVVFLVGLEEGIFPHSRVLEEPRELEEERRLAYVGLTRAREYLYLTHCWQRTLYGHTRSNQPSRFLLEIPREFLTTRDPLDHRPDAGRLREAAAPAPKVALADLIPGDVVRHRKWGVGTVTAVRGQGPSAEIRIDFPRLGVKTLLAQYAPLERASAEDL